MFQQFNAAEAERVKSHFANLCQLALADAIVTKAETEYLQKLCRNYGLSKEEFDFIMDHAFEINFVAPEKPMERLEHVYEMVGMVLLDDIIDERKVDLCVKVAQRLSFKAHVVGDLIKALVTLHDDIGQNEAKLEKDDLQEILKENRS